MGCADGNENAGFANFEPAETVNDSDAMDGEFLVEQLANLSHLGEGHRLVGFVVEIKGATAMRFVTDKPVESHDGTVLGSADVTNDRGHVDGRMEKGEKIVFCEGVQHGCRMSTPADRRKKRNRIIVGEARVPRSKLFVAGSDE